MGNDISTFENKAPEILVDLAEHIKMALMDKHKMSNEQAMQTGIDIAQKIAKDWGGEVIYIPRAILFTLNERDLKIWREFNGFNHRELARKYGVSMQWVYQIVKRIQKEEIAKRQVDMFADEENA
ncbi:Mor family transcriptional regulator [Volucribacter psittacicida]|uniref:Mor family transcriptional regulator n=1 Tax=Volucribacter psittacicida TaxID=203482 RepID=A0A4R1FR15_9PAST|nr:Mor transcription activator family protein [Volucribacter psittacicida]TCJ95939.1 Mor family transcriptional regulator [Volucribacter psittacicida]